jgi:YidC/Oxa1 family membrane protein insertase
MDFQRYLLIGAIAVLSYMLLVEWGQFKTANSVDPVEQYQSISQANSSTELPTAVVEQGSGDLPTAEPVAVPEVTATAQQAKIISVKTDSLEVGIDTLGGDIIFAALPKHLAKIDNPDAPFVLLENGQRRTYIAQSGLIGRNGIDTAEGRAQFSAAASEFVLADDAEQLVVDLKHRAESGVVVTKRFSFKRGEYLVDVEYLVDNQSGADWTAVMFGQLKRDNTIDPSADTSGMGMQPYLGAAMTTPEEPYKKISFEDMAEKNVNQTLAGGWIAILQHYFVSAWIPNAEQTHHYSSVVTQNRHNIIRFTSPAITVPAGQQGKVTAQLYVGPKDQYSLEQISKGLELTVDYGFLWWIAQPLFWVLTQMHKLFGNWGWAIIGVTVMVKALFFHLNTVAYKSMANMRKAGPEMQRIKEMYGDDRQKMSQEMMNLYKKEKINPLGGCLPILVQMPVFIALYWVLMESVELRHAPWIGWIHDLSVMDPYYILPLIMGASMFIQQKLNPTPPDPMQAKVMQWMPVLFTFFFLFFPAGLVLYWVVNNVLSIAQQYVITKRIEAL